MAVIADSGLSCRGVLHAARRARNQLGDGGASRCNLPAQQPASAIITPDPLNSAPRNTSLNACLDEVERTQSEPLRKLINGCKPTKFTFLAEGTCSADLCFKANVLFGVQTKGVVAQPGGACP
jgi:hypothetical protein